MRDFPQKDSLRNDLPHPLYCHYTVIDHWKPHPQLLSSSDSDNAGRPHTGGLTAGLQLCQFYASWTIVVNWNWKTHSKIIVINIPRSILQSLVILDSSN